MDQHHMTHLAEATQAPINKATSKLLNLIDGLLKAYRDKRKNEHRIKVKVDGKTKFRATVDKTGRLKIHHNTLTNEEIQALQNYFKSIPTPAIDPKAFDVMVDNNTVLQTRHGEVVNRAQPQQPDAFVETGAIETFTPDSVTREAESTPSPPVEAKQSPTQAPPAQQPQRQPEQTQATPAPQSQPQSTQPPAQTTPAPQAQSEQPPAQTTPAPQPQSEQLPIQGLSNPPAPTGPQISETEPVPADFGLGQPITDQAIVATGDRDLVAAHGQLEAKRLELNYCIKRGSEPGLQPLQQRATDLRAEINRDLPKFAEQLNRSIAQGKYDPAKRTAPGLDRDMPRTPKKQQTPSQSKSRALSKK